MGSWAGNGKPEVRPPGCSRIFSFGKATGVIADLRGKGGHMRTIPVPAWVKQSVDSWSLGAGIQFGGRHPHWLKTLPRGFRRRNLAHRLAKPCVPRVRSEPRMPDHQEMKWT